MKRTAPLLLIFALAACGSQKAVRPTAPAPVVAETQTYTIDYKAAKGSERIKAVYVNSNRPITVELHQGGTVETLTQVQFGPKAPNMPTPTPAGMCRMPPPRSPAKAGKRLISKPIKARGLFTFHHAAMPAQKLTRG